MTTIEQLAGQVLIGGFPGQTVPPELGRALSAGELGGVILFGRNVATVEQVRELNAALRDAAGGRLWLAVDQEGGRVQRVGARHGATAFPPMGEVGARGEAEVRRVSRQLATELKAMGFNLNLAPVLDVDSNPANPVIGARAFSKDAAEVALLGRAFFEEHQRLGMGVCGKHFPGHGDTTQDSHVDLPHLAHTMERLEAVELLPFRAAIAAGVPAIMTAHVVLDRLTSAPGTMAPEIVGKLLRQTLGFTGVVVSDDLEMGAIARAWEVGAAAVQALRAGVDLLLVCGAGMRWREAHAALVETAQREPAFHQRLADAAPRVGAYLDSVT